MRSRIYVNGRPAWSDNEPAHARVQGHGGASLGFFSGTLVKPQPVKHIDPRQFQEEPGVKRDRPICGVPLRVSGEPCHRLPGHADKPGATRWQREHRSAYTMDNATKRRRMYRPRGGMW